MFSYAYDNMGDIRALKDNIYEWYTANLSLLYPDHHGNNRVVTVVGVALAGVPAAYRLLFNSYNDKDAITLGIALGGLCFRI